MKLLLSVGLICKNEQQDVFGLQELSIESCGTTIHLGYRRALASGLLISSFLFSISAAENFPRCDCNEEGFWNVENILECQKVSDFLIAVAYFSIPIELLYFVSCSNVPFKWVLFQFIAFIVLCGMTHLLNGWTYGPHPFQLMLALTIFKFLTALVSFATAITLITLIPLLLKVKVREFMLKKKTWDLGREVGIIKKQKEAGWHVRMLTQEIRKSLDRHTILYTTLVELFAELCCWMPNEAKTEMNLTHELKGRNALNLQSSSIPITDPDVREIKGSTGVKILGPDSALAIASSRGSIEPGAVAAIRMPMLRVCNFKGGTPEMIQTCYAILVLVLPGGLGRNWSHQELEIVKDAMMASQARNAFQKVMSDGMRRPMHSILGLLSVMQDENLNGHQRILVDAMVKTSNVLSNLINDVMDISSKDSGRFLLEARSFGLHSMVKEAACVAKCLCIYNGYDFVVEVDKSLPEQVVGDERRRWVCKISVCLESESQGRNDPRWATWRASSSDGYASVKFEIGVSNHTSQFEGSIPRVIFGGRRYSEEGLSFSICRKLVKLMQGNIRVVPNSDCSDQSMSFVLRLQPWSSVVIGISESGETSEHPPSNSLFRGLQVLLADDDDVNRGVTRKLLQKTWVLRCECLSALDSAVLSFQIVLLDLQMPDMDGFEVAMRIRKFRSRSWPLIIALTASGDEEVREKCSQTGMNGLIRKPVLLQGVADELRRVLLQANRIV
ncbi:unnamed protein product [Thlaspi arvense]|uniref:Ethylene receptor n=1 Tax=Thlaspi arvense TaxID=13288 RepID=A0AAU9SKQ6_THLAR|nr:unnamed protein product [Thlaspi arvense]